MYQHEPRQSSLTAETKRRPCAIAEVMPEVLARYGLSLDVPECHNASLVTAGNTLDLGRNKNDCLAKCS